MIGALVLAAGESRRMGKPKLTIQIQGRSMIEWILDAFKGIVDRIIVVVGYKPENLIPKLEQLGIEWVVNREFHRGMIYSIKCGLEQLKGCDAVFIALGDQPFIDPIFLREALDSWKSGAKIVSPVFEGKKGHPVLLDRSLFDEVLSLEENQTLRDLIYKHQSEHRLIQAGPWALLDIDTPQDLKRATWVGRI